MAFFTQRDRLAVGIICLLVALGWGTRYAVHRVRGGDESSGVRIIRNAVPVPEALTPQTSASDTIDINTADAALLETLPMIGPSRARAIVEYREEHGPFASPEAVTAVPGIGPGILGAIRDRITAGRDSSASAR